MVSSPGCPHRPTRRAATALVVALTILAWLTVAVRAQTPQIDYGQPPAGWSSAYGAWFREETESPTGRTGHFARMDSGEMEPPDGQEKIIFRAALGVQHRSDLDFESFRQQVGQGAQCDPMDDGTTVTPQVSVTDGQFHGYPAVIATLICRHPSHEYPDLLCDMSGNCQPNDDGIAAYWEGGYTAMTRQTCFETTPSGPCTLVSEEVVAETLLPAALGDNPENAIFEGLVAEIDGWKARWSIAGSAGAGDDVPPLAPPADPGSDVVVVCDTYCLNDVDVSSPFCDCAPASSSSVPPPASPGGDDGIAALVVIVIILGGAIGGGGFLVSRVLRRRPKARPHPAPTPPAERVLVDALGRKHVYVRDEQGRYINQQTGGELDESRWEDYNRSLLEDRRFADRQREKLAERRSEHDRQMDQMVERQKQAQRDLHALQQMERSLLFNPDRRGLWRGPGEPGDIYTHVKELRQQLVRGEEIDRRRLKAVRRLYRDHTQGTVLTPDEMPSDGAQTREVITGTLEGMARELVTQQSPDGGISFKSMGLRLIANVATGGKIELVLTPLESAYTMHDYVQQGGDSPLEGFGRAAGDLLKGEAMSLLGEVGARRLKRMAKAKPQPPRARTPRARPPSHYSGADVDITPHMGGMPKANIRRAQELAQKHNVQIVVRPTNPHAHRWLANGHGSPKPSFIKNKTISSIDTQLGASADDLGKVGHFKPELPPRASVPDDKAWQKVTKRYVQRLKEYKAQAGKMDHLRKQGKVVVRNKVVYEVLPDGSMGRPYCGDHDLFEVLDGHGRPCPEPLKKHVMNELQKPPFSAQHPPHMDWDYSGSSRTPPTPGAQSPFEIEQGIDQAVRSSHRPGGEPLIKFQPGTRQPIEGLYYTGP